MVSGMDFFSNIFRRMSSYIWGGNDPDQKEVDLGVENKFVYDKALGRWVIPGEPLEPEPKSPAPAAPPPPPPPPGGYVNQGSPPPSAVPGGHGEFDASTLLVARAHPNLKNAPPPGQRQDGFVYTDWLTGKNVAVGDVSNLPDKTAPQKRTPGAPGSAAGVSSDPFASPPPQSSPFGGPPAAPGPAPVMPTAPGPAPVMPSAPGPAPVMPSAPGPAPVAPGPVPPVNTGYSGRDMNMPPGYHPTGSPQRLPGYHPTGSPKRHIGPESPTSPGKRPSLGGLQPGGSGSPAAATGSLMVNKS